MRIHCQPAHPHETEGSGDLKTERYGDGPGICPDATERPRDTTLSLLDRVSPMPASRILVQLQVYSRFFDPAKH